MSDPAGQRPDQERDGGQNTLVRLAYDSTKEHIAVIDPDGVIIHHNQRWLEFARENGLRDLTSVSVGANYLATCAGAEGPCRLDAEHVRFSLKSLLAGRIDAFDYEYPCHSLLERRWFSLYARPIRKDGAIIGAVITHNLITRQMLAEERLDEIQRIAEVGVFEHNFVTAEAYWSENIHRLLGLPPSQPPSHEEFKRAISPADLPEFQRRLHLALDSRMEALNTEFRVQRPGQRTRHLELRCRLHYTPVGKPLRILGALLDVSRTRRYEAKLRVLASQDPLTRLANRRSFFVQLSHELLRAKRTGSSLGVALFDIDHFKDINDRYGHDFGDTVLRALSQAAARQVRKYDALARVGGEEFAVILSDLGREQMISLCERLRARIEALSVDHPDGPVKATISIGLTFLDDPLATGQHLYARADEALYEAKRGGRNRLCIHVP